MKIDMRAVMSDELRMAAERVVERLRAAGHLAYYVGGCVRDMLLARQVEDIDIATDATPDEVIALFRRTVPVGAQFGVVLVLDGDFQFEVATFRADAAYHDGRHPESVRFTNPEEDARRRDFTINGLFYDPVKNIVHDYVDGEKDMRTGIIRAIRDPRERFMEDKLRMLRAVRFAARFEFPIEEETFQSIVELKHLIHEVSCERIREELVKMFTDRAPGKSFELLDETGLLEEVLPEITAMKGVAQPPEFHPEGDVFEHTRIMMHSLTYPSVHLAFATLLHDVGKPSTMRVEDRIRFSCHDIVGAKMTEKILKRLKFSNKDIDAIVQCVKNHMNIMHVQKMRVGKLKRLIARETFETELELHKIDCEASHGDIGNYTFLCEKKEEFSHENLTPKPLVTGNDLIAAGLTPGPQFKDILAEAMDAQLEGLIASEDDANLWLKKKLAALDG